MVMRKFYENIGIGVVSAKICVSVSVSADTDITCIGRTLELTHFGVPSVVFARNLPNNLPLWIRINFSKR